MASCARSGSRPSPSFAAVHGDDVPPLPCDITLLGERHVMSPSGGPHVARAPTRGGEKRGDLNRSLVASRLRLEPVPTPLYSVYDPPCVTTSTAAPTREPEPAATPVPQPQHSLTRLEPEVLTVAPPCELELLLSEVKRLYSSGATSTPTAQSFQTFLATWRLELQPQVKQHSSRAGSRFTPLLPYSSSSPDTPGSVVQVAGGPTSTPLTAPVQVGAVLSEPLAITELDLNAANALAGVAPPAEASSCSSSCPPAPTSTVDGYDSDSESEAVTDTLPPPLAVDIRMITHAAVQPHVDGSGSWVTATGSRHAKRRDRRVHAKRVLSGYSSDAAAQCSDGGASSESTSIAAAHGSDGGSSSCLSRVGVRGIKAALLTGALDVHSDSVNSLFEQRVSPRGSGAAAGGGDGDFDLLLDAFTRKLGLQDAAQLMTAPPVMQSLRIQAGMHQQQTHLLRRGMMAIDPDAAAAETTLRMAGCDDV